MLNELEVKRLLKKSLYEFISALESNSLYYVEYEAKCKAYMEVLNNKDMLEKYKYLNIDNARILFSEISDIEEVPGDERVIKAIHNILKEDGYKKIVSIGFGGMISDDGNIIARNSFDMQRVFTFKVKDDVIYIKNGTTGQVVYEKFISSYQNEFSFTIDK